MYHRGMSADSLSSRAASFFRSLKRKLRGGDPGRAAVHSSGAALVVMLTTRCNLRCKTCLRGKSSQVDLDLDLLDPLLDGLKALGFTAVSFTGGEAILHPRFGEAVRKVYERGLQIAVVTNGLLYRDYLKVLEPFRDKVLFVAVSLDSHLKELNDRVRGDGVYERAVEAAKAFREAGYTLKLSHVVNRHNFRQLGDFMDFANSALKPSAVVVGAVIRTGGNSGLELSGPERDELHAALRRAALKHRNIYPTVSTGVHGGLFYCNHFNGLAELTVNSAGEMVFCCDNPEAGRPLGSLREKSLAELIGRFYEAQAAVKAALTKDKLSGAKDCPCDCDRCSELLGRFLRG